MKKRIIPLALACVLLLSLAGCALPEAVQELLPGNRPQPSPAPAQTETASGGALTARKYAVTFDPNGGEVTEGETSQLVRGGELPQAPAVAMDGYVFDGWEPEISEASGSAVYTAQWKQVTYNSEELFAEISPAMVEITVYDEHGESFALGSGFFIDDQGTLVTNYHVIEGACSADAALYDGTVYEIPVIQGYDSALDIAVLKTNAEETAFLPLSDAGVRTGETIYALGSSQGLTGTFSSGIVSTASRESDGVNYIQITAPISSGNSGGPLVNVHGQAVGINTMILTVGQNLNFATDIRELDKVDLSEPITFEEYYEETGSHISGIEAEQVGYFYDDAPYAEIESNDAVLQADILHNDKWCAGELTDAEDADWFYIELDKPGKVLFEAVPYYVEDDEYLLSGVVTIGDEDFEIVEVLEPTDSLNFDIEDSCEITFDEAGIYFLTVVMDDAYPDSTPLYYQVRATW